MFWNDIADIRKELKQMKRSIDELHCRMFQGPMYCRCKPKMGVITEEHEGEESKLEHLESLVEQLQESFEDWFVSDDEHSPFNKIHDKLTLLVEDENRLDQVALCTKTLDKFEDYMKNVDKLNALINEIKGVASVTRSMLDEKKQFDQTLKEIKELAELAKKNNESSMKYAEYAMGLHNQHFKIDALYRNLVEIQSTRKPRKRVKKTSSP